MNLPQRMGIPVKISDGQLAISHQLHFIESVGRLFDYDVVPFVQ